MTYKLNPEAKAFSYTREELFECITKIVAHPASAEARALAIMLVVDDYFTDYVQSDNNGGYCVYECDELDFQDFAIQKLGLEYYHYVDVDEVLK
jgi:hypothetical protein